MPEGVLVQTNIRLLPVPLLEVTVAGKNASHYNFTRVEFCKRLSSSQAVAEDPCRIAQWEEPDLELTPCTKPSQSNPT
jgi:hypothetical protein